MTMPSPAEPARTAGVLLQVAYDGTAFSGWATQPDARTVEDALRGAVRALDPRATPPRGTSRTDAGVHAEGQMAAFDTHLDIPPRGWVLALNQHLPDDVAVRRARAVPVGYAPRFASRQKRYAYRLLLDKVRDPLLRTRAWRLGFDMDTDLLAREARSLVGTHDFCAFRTAGDARAETVRTIASARLERTSDPRELRFVIEGNAFLYNMVRIVTGTLVDVARGRLPEGTIAAAIAGKERRLAGQTAPAHGLVLEEITLDLPEGSGDAWPP
jgi:tRNA pseudouridine38-40 synthase